MLHASQLINGCVEGCKISNSHVTIPLPGHQKRAVRALCWFFLQSFTTTALSLIKDYQTTWFCFLNEVLFVVAERLDPRLKRSMLVVYQSSL